MDDSSYKIKYQYAYINGYPLKENGLNLNYSEAIKYFLKSAQLQNKKACLMMSNLANNFMIKGKTHFIYKRNYLRARYFYELASQFNYPEAITRLGDLYFNGNGVGQDYSKAEHYYNIASNLYFPEALMKMGDMNQLLLIKIPHLFLN